MNRWLGFFLATITGVLNWLLFRLFFQHYYPGQGEVLATILIASIFLHEIGHMIVLEKNGIRTYILFLVILGGTITYKQDRDKEKNLPWATGAAVSLAGVMANFLLIILSLVGESTGLLTGSIASKIINLNGILILYNLLPFFIFDGGHFSKYLFNSTPEKRLGNCL